jgi:F-type H+-transporting ATPase subunit delta
MRDLLRGYAVALLESAAAAGRAQQVSTELEVFSAALVNSEALRNVLTDVTIPFGPRRGVVHDILNGAAPETRALASWAVLVEPAPDVPAAVFALVELARETAEAAGEGQELRIGAEELLGGRTAVRERIRGYADRIFQEVDRLERIDEIEDEVVGVAGVLDSSRDLRQALVDRSRPVFQRVALMTDLFGDKVQPATRRLISYVLRAGHVRDLVGALEWVAGLAAEERGRRIADVRAAVELDADEYERLAVALERALGRPVELRVRVDPELMGGMSVTIGDTVIDGSVRHRLDQLRETLAPSGAWQNLESRP